MILEYEYKNTNRTILLFRRKYPDSIPVHVCLNYDKYENDVNHLKIIEHSSISSVLNKINAIKLITKNKNFYE